MLQDDADLAMKIATFRFGVIADFVSGVRLGYGEKERRLAEKSLLSYGIPGSMRTRVTRASMLAWIAAYRKGGYRIESLTPKKRSDRGEFRSLSTPVRMEIKRLKGENPYYTLPVILKKLRHSQVISPDEVVNKATIYRFIRQECAAITPDEGVDRRRFEAEHSNDIWQCDVLHGPMVRVDGVTGLKKSYLLAILDDHSRLIVFANFYLSEDFATLRDGLREAISRRGIPGKFYVDNGACYRAEDLERILACLGVTLSHSRPYKPQGRGKVERWFKNIRDSFFPMLPSHPLSLEELNERLEEFVSTYNNSEHSSIGATPYERYRADLACIRPAPERLMDYFRSHEYRRVKKDRTVQLHRKVFEVSAKLIDKTVDLLFHAHDPDEIEVLYQGISYGKAIPINLAVNARGGRDWGQESTSNRQEDRPVATSSVLFSPQGGQLFDAMIAEKGDQREEAP
jgi:putative transposase